MQKSKVGFKQNLGFILNYLKKCSIIALQESLTNALNWASVFGVSIWGAYHDYRKLPMSISNNWHDIVISAITYLIITWIAIFIFRFLFIVPFAIWKDNQITIKQQKIKIAGLTRKKISPRLYFKEFLKRMRNEGNNKIEISLSVNKYKNELLNWSHKCTSGYAIAQGKDAVKRFLNPWNSSGLVGSADVTDAIKEAYESHDIKPLKTFWDAQLNIIEEDLININIREIKEYKFEDLDEVEQTELMKQLSGDI